MPWGEIIIAAICIFCSVGAFGCLWLLYLILRASARNDAAIDNAWEQIPHSDQFPAIPRVLSFARQTGASVELEGARTFFHGHFCDCCDSDGWQTIWPPVSTLFHDEENSDVEQ